MGNLTGLRVFLFDAWVKYFSALDRQLTNRARQACQEEAEEQPSKIRSLAVNGRQNSKQKRNKQTYWAGFILIFFLDITRNLIRIYMWF